MKKKFEFSKLIILVTTALFIGTLYLGFQMDFTSYQDTTFIVAVVGITGTLVCTSVVAYLKKAQTENTIKIKMDLIKTTTDNQIYLYREMQKIKKEFGINDYEFDNMNAFANADDFSSEAISSANDVLYVAETEGTSPIEVQHVN